MSVRDTAALRLQEALPAFLAAASGVRVALASVTEHGRHCPAFDKYDEHDEAADLSRLLARIADRLEWLCESLQQEGGDDEQ